MSGLGFWGRSKLPNGPIVTWDPIWTDTSITLSNSNLTATITTNPGNWHLGYATLNHTTGKRVFASRINNLTSFGSVGMANHGQVLSGFLGNSTNSFGLRQDGIYQYNGGTTSVGVTYATGDIVVVAVDITNSKTWFGVYHSGTLTWALSGDPVAGTNPTNTTGTTAFYPAYGLYNLDNEQQTGLFTASALAGLIPTGFLPWDLN